MMTALIRQELQSDFVAVKSVLQAAFLNETYSDKTEHLLVERLRNSTTFIPELSLVAELSNHVVGYILLSEISIQSKNQVNRSLALAPVAVHPKLQGQGIGGQLIRRSHDVAKSLGYKSIVLLGHAKYYPRFGYEKTTKYGISLPFGAPDENCMIISLVPGALDEISGVVKYPKAFFD